MGQGSGADSDAWDALALDWVRLGPIADAGYQELLERFKRCR
jgi:hypothetical protein